MFLRQTISRRLNQYGLALILPLCSLVFSFLLSNSTYADGSITVTISGDPSITVAPSAEGTFAESSNINIGVTGSSASGYTLAIAANNGTSLIGTTDNTKSITSINSPLSAQAFDSSAYNNQWGYKPSMHYNTSTGQRASNTNFLPSPTASGDIIDITNDNSNNNYTLSIGTRVTNTIGPQSYKNTFVITVVGNIVQCDNTKLCIEYEGNGLTFDGETTNRVNYNSVTTHIPTTKYAHTPNVSDAGEASGTYAPNMDATDTVTIDGATSLNATIYYDTESAQYDWVSVYQPPFDISNTNDATVSTTTGNLSGKLAGRESGRTTTYSSWYAQNYTISGDTVKFHFRSDSGDNYYGYYAIITGTGTIHDRFVSSGEYATPTGVNPVFHGWSTVQTTPGGGLPGDVEYANESEILAKMPGDEGETKTLYAVWQNGQVITFTKDNNIAKIDVLDSDGTTVGTIIDGVQSLALAQGSTYILKLTYATGYTYSTITKTSGSGIVGGRSFTVGAGPATINFTSQTYPNMQNYNCSDLANVGDMIDVKDTRDNEVYLIGKLADGKCWMLDNLALDLTNATVKNNLSSSNTNATDTSINYLRNGGGSDSSQYATNGVADWTIIQSIIDPLVNLTNKNIIPNDSTSTTGGYKVGGYYNYCATTAGSYCYQSVASSGNATEDICPRGWRLPTGNASGEFSALANAIYGSTDTTSDPTAFANYRAALHLPLSGYFYNSSAYSQGSKGHWWSSTRNDNGRMYALELYYGEVRPRAVSDRNEGYSLRCIAR